MSSASAVPKEPSYREPAEAAPDSGPGYREAPGGLVEVTADLSGSPLYNHDLAPTRLSQRTWGVWHIASLWVGMSVCVPTYMLASGLMKEGMSWWQSLVTVLLGNAIVLVPMTLNAHAGTRYGVPFPVLLRASFGTKGANVPAMGRALVACGWFGIQTWLGGVGLYQMFAAMGADPGRLPNFLPAALGLTTGQLACFLAFWAVNVFFIYKGTESIRLLETLAAPFLILAGLALLAWGYFAAGGFGPMLAQGPTFPEGTSFWAVFFPGLTGMVGFWATLSLNIPDFMRYARSQRDQALGQAIGLPTTMTLFAFIGVAVTSATVVVYGEALWNPLDLLARFENPAVQLATGLALAIATLSTNIAANVVGPANDISNLSPRRISFKMGGYITALVGILMMPWKLLADASGYIFTWLVGYSALLGPIAGIMIADYYIVRRRKLDPTAFYRETGPFRYTSGFHVEALVILALAILPNVPGFLLQVGALEPGTPLMALFARVYTYAWFVGFAIAFGLYATVSASAREARAARAS